MSTLFASADTGVPTGLIVVYLAFIVLMIIGWWRIFAKAGEPGWKAIIPIYNVLVLMKIIGRPLWWIVLFLIPCVGIVVWIIAMNDLSKSYGRSSAFTVGLVLLSPIFALILGFGSAQYLGPAGPVKDQKI